MVRILPKSIAGRTTMALIAGVLLIMTISAAVFSLSLFDGARPLRPGRLIERVVSLTAIVNDVPAAVRPDVLSTVHHPGLVVRWVPHARARASVARDWTTAWVERRLRRALRRIGIGTVVVGHLQDPARPVGGLAFARAGPLVVWVELADGTWLNFAAAEEWHSFSRLIGFALAIVIVGGGITGLAVWVARKVTAPLGHFAAAAARLGTDVEAPPLSESGPTEIREAAEAFNLMQKRIRRFLEDRTLMVAAVSHDLRTPITRMRLRAEFIDDDEQRAKMLKDLDDMEAMIASTIAFAREETATEPRIEVDLGDLLEDVRSSLVDAGLTIRLERPDDVTYECRPMALKRAFANLIENAVTYGGSTVVGLADRDDHVVVTIDDDGPGIPEDEREKVFAPFYRLERSRSRDTGGTGLGLSVARTVIRGHGGDVTLTNRAEGGLRQMVVLPRPGERRPR